MLLVAAVAVAAEDSSAVVSCFECLQMEQEAGSLIGCVQTCQRHKVALADCQTTCRLLRQPSASCQSLSLCPSSRSEAQQHEARQFGHGKGVRGEPAVRER